MGDIESRFLRACRGEAVDCTPVWFMRQAGRYMSEYRKLREEFTLLQICARPDLIKEVTLQPMRRFDLDAAIIFADILLPLESLGIPFDFASGEGPRIHQPLRSPQDVDRLQLGDPERDLASVMEGIRLTRAELTPQTALIGFAGGPFTVASYAIEGGSSRNFLETKRFLYSHPEAWDRLMELFCELTIRYLSAQIRAGVQAVQLFDSWVGCLGPEDYRRYVLPYSRRIFEELKTHSVPTIHFGTGTATLLELMQEAGSDVMGVDWRIPLEEAWRRLGSDTPLQGNLDPTALMAPRAVLEAQVARVLEQGKGHRGHIFNLGHGILPQTPVENVEAVIGWVHQRSQPEGRPGRAIAREPGPQSK